jgi:molybdopterin-containing oxidoreductase family iron-sulfur binding subunit
MGIRVVVADADPDYRARLVKRLRATPDLEIVGELAPDPEAFSAAVQAAPDVLLVRVEVPLDGQLDGIRTLRRAGRRPLVLVLGRLGRTDTERAQDAGADAVVSPAVGSRALARLIRVLWAQREPAPDGARRDHGRSAGGRRAGVSRRRFLRNTLLGAAGAGTLTTLAASPARAEGASVPPRTDLDLPPDAGSILVRMQRDLQRAIAKPLEERKWAMVIDLRKCIGCSACTVACVAENHLPPGVVYRPVSEQEVGTYPNVSRQFLPRPCMQCDDPPCTDVCPVAATYKRPDGVVEINYEKCIGCRYCIPACPYGARTFDWGENWTDGTPAFEPYEAAPPPEYGQRWPKRSPGSGASPIGNVRKCQFCLHRLNAGMLPACTSTCVGAATYFGDMNDPESLVSRLIGNENVERLREDKGTEPKVYYLR